MEPEEQMLKRLRSSMTVDFPIWERSGILALEPLRTAGDGQDRISRLPDDLLHHILSFLDITHVIPTIYLSSRWRRLFASLPFLSFDKNVYEQETMNRRKGVHIDFIDYVDGVLCLRDANSHNNEVVSLRVFMDTSYMKIPDANAWIDFATRHNVQKFDLKIPLQHVHLPLPVHNLLTSELLTSLELYTPFTRIPIPNGLLVNLPQLKDLHLGSFYLDGDTISKNFFARCPVLEKLKLTSCKLQNDSLNLIISAHQLKHLEIGSFGSLVKLLTVFAPKLTLLLINNRGKIIYDYALHNTSSLIEARVVSYHYVRDKMIKLLNQICHVTSLTLSAGLLEVKTLSFGIPTRLENKLMPFCNLMLLKLQTSLSRNQILCISHFLEKCPNLKALVLKLWGGSITSKAEIWKEQFALHFKLDNVEVIEIKGVEGYCHELEFLKFLLKNAAMLKKMVVFTSKEHLFTLKNKNEQQSLLEMFMDELATSSRASSFFNGQ